MENKESSNLAVQCISNCIVSTSEDMDRILYAVKVEVEEEATLFTECRILAISKYKGFSILQKLLGISNERYDMLAEVLSKNPDLQETEWPVLLQRYGLEYEPSSFSDYFKKRLSETVTHSRQEAEVAVRFRILINGREAGYSKEDYKDFIEFADYHFADFEHLLDKYGDKFMGRLVRKFFERRAEQALLNEYRIEQQKMFPKKLLFSIFELVVIGAFCIEAVPFSVFFIVFMYALDKVLDYHYETI